MKLYVYDHCPYCVKARMIFGLKDLPFEMETLLNDDEATPIRMIGQKMLPILKREDGVYMPESMDIVRYVDAEYGRKVLTGKRNQAIATWIEGTREYLYPLCMPRWVKAHLKEFATKNARDYFIRKKEAMIGSFEEQLEHTDAWRDKAEAHLKLLEPLIVADDAVNGELSEDDIHLFAALRSLSIVRGLSYPPKVDAYRKQMAERCGISLHDALSQ